MTLHSGSGPKAIAFLAVWALAGGGAVEGQSDPFELLEAASARFESITTLCADFHQVLDVPLIGQRKEGSGRLCQRRPNLFSMRFSDPAGDLVVVDGENAWVYTPSQSPEQVLKEPASSVGPGLDFHGEFLDMPRAKYEILGQVSEMLAGLRVRRIELRPRTDASYQTAVVWIDEELRLLRQVEISEENGSVRTVTLSAIEIDGPVSDAVFAFTPPPGTRVISR